MTLPETDFLAELRAKDPCTDGWAWARENQATSVADAWARLPRADWMLWLAEAFGVELDADRLRAFAFECADRAVRIHAVAALRSAGLGAEADSLAAVAPIMDAPSAKVAAKVAAWAAAGDAGAARAAAAKVAARVAWAAAGDAGAAGAAWAAWAAWAAAGDAAGAARAAESAAGAARAAGVAAGAARAAEGLWQADRLRTLLPGGRAMTSRDQAHRDVPPSLWSEVVAVLAEGAAFVALVVVMCVLLIVLDAA